MANAGAAAFKASDPSRTTDLDGSHSVSAMRQGDGDAEEFRFGTFRLFPYQRLLLDGDAPVQLGSRAFDILIALLKRPGDLMSKGELIAQVWPDTTVEEANLRVHMAVLRKALRDQDRNSRFICNIPGRGYRFAAPVSHPEPQLHAVPPADAAPSVNGLPISLTRMFGRSDVIGSLTAQLQHHRLITVVGPGGIGKTRVAVATAEGLAGCYSDGVRYVDLASAVDPPQVRDLLAKAVGLDARSEDPVPDLIAFLGERRILIVLDNCEHVIQATAGLVEKLHAGTSAVHVLATSREPLRCTGEWVRRLPPLPCPAASPRLTAADALTYAAVELFVDRISASNNAFELDDDNAAAVGHICRRLDGIPLAIELAAGRFEAFGTEGLAAQVDQPLRLLSRGRRTADPRHRSLGAMLDWSYRLLSESERAVLRRLAIFPCQFTLPAACAVAAGSPNGSNVVEDVASLISKSLVIADFSDETARYRLLDTTRTYAFDKLAASGELDAMTRRYAEGFPPPAALARRSSPRYQPATPDAAPA